MRLVIYDDAGTGPSFELISYPVVVIGGGARVPPPPGQPGQVLGYDASGQPIAIDLVDPDPANRLQASPDGLFVGPPQLSSTQW